jgi:protein-S-isoprenylcysteine O-methyltransferase Ste14
MDKKKFTWHAGVGPVYVIIIFLLTAVALYMENLNYLSSGVIPEMKIPLLVAGVVLILTGAVLWTGAVFISKINSKVEENKLVTTGIYAWVRNPVYSAIAIVLTGILCLYNNMFLLVMPFIYWLLLSIIVRKEEAVLEEKFASEYLLYKSKVNRCIPWFPE